MLLLLLLLEGRQRSRTLMQQMLRMLSFLTVLRAVLLNSQRRGVMQKMLMMRVLVLQGVYGVLVEVSRLQNRELKLNKLYNLYL